jgi:HEAT repeat protein
VLKRRPRINRLVKKHDVPGLLRALSYRDIWTDPSGIVYDLGAVVRRDAVLALDEIQSDADAAELDVGAAFIACLDDPSEEVRRAAAMALGRRSEQRSVPALCRLAVTAEGPLVGVLLADLEGMDRVTVLDAATALALDHPGDEGRAAELVVRLVGDNRELRQDVLRRAESVLLDDDERRLERAAGLLIRFGPTSAPTLLAVLDRRPSAPVVAALGRLGVSEARVPLLSLVWYSDAAVRRAALAALGEIADSYWSQRRRPQAAQEPSGSSAGYVETSEREDAPMFE